MNPAITESISVITVLLQGFLSFFSPCVLPLLPLYLGYLSGGTGSLSSDGELKIGRMRVLFNTVCFVLGISFSFFVLGLGMRAIGRFFGGNHLLFSRIGGIIVILFGLYQLGLFGSSSLLMREKRLPIHFDKMAMSPVTALIMGFVFSFAWTPCVGPALSSVLIMAASRESAAAGFGLIGVYTIGFTIPFIVTGLFTTTVLEFFKRHRDVMRYTMKISGVLLILMGVLMITGFMNGITGYLADLSGSESTAVVQDEADDPGGEPAVEEGGTGDLGLSGDADAQMQTAEEDKMQVQDQEDTASNPETDDGGEDGSEETKTDDDEEDFEEIPAFDFTLTDQYGVTHTLSDYKGKIVFLNFWTTWCPPCRAEMPFIQALYEETEADEDSDLVILSVAWPNAGRETDEEGIMAFFEENGYTYPVLMDTDGSLSMQYFITSYPTTYMIDSRGNIYGYAPGAMTKETMEDVIAKTRESVSDK